MWGLHVTSSIPNALPTAATIRPISPKPMRPRRCPFRTCGRPFPSRQPPLLSNAVYGSRRLAAARISAQVSSAVAGFESAIAVLATGMPRAASALKSSCVLRPPVKMKSSRFGIFDRSSALNGVRSRISTIAFASLTAPTSASPRKRSVWYSTSASFSTGDQSAVRRNWFS